MRTLFVQIAIDDFGTGESSLDHLRSFSFDYLKIDKSYVQDVIEDEGDASLVKAIIQMGHSFGIEVVAEGVETSEQLSFLQSYGCDMMQGYLLSKPLPMDEALEFVEQNLVQSTQKLDIII